MSSPDDVLNLFEQKAFQFKAYRDGDRKLIDCLKPLVNVVQAVSSILGQIVSQIVSTSPSRFHHSAATQVPFPPAGAIFAGVNILLAVRVPLRLTSIQLHDIGTLQAASGVSSSYDALVELFECIGNFLKRLRIYTDLPLTPLMTDIIAKIMAELLSVLDLATKQIKQGRFSKWVLIFYLRSPI